MMRHLTIDWYPLLSGWAIALVVASLLGLVVWGAKLLLRKQVPRRWVVGLGVARIVAVLLFTACLVQPVISYLRAVQHPPELLVLLDTSESMGQIDGDGDGPSRLASAVAALQRGKLVEALEEHYRVQWFTFDRRARPVTIDALNGLEPRGTTTDFANALKSALEVLAAEATDQALMLPPRRVLLVSDGQDRGTDDLVAAALGTGTVIDVLIAGEQRAASTNVPTVTQVQTASRVLLASETQFVVTIASGQDPQPRQTLTLFEDGQSVLTQDVALGSGEQHVKIVYRPSEPGWKRYEFALQSPGVVPNPAVAPRHGVNVQVVDDKIEVLVLEDRWRWEFKYLRRVLEDDPSFNLTAMLARGAGSFMQVGEPERRVTLGSFPQSRAELDWFDVLVLGDVRPSRWPSGLSEAVADAVIEGGKSLIVVAGPALGELVQSPELHALLPVELLTTSGYPLEGPLDIQLTPEGARSGLFAAVSAANGGRLPAIDRVYAALRKRPAANVLVEAASEANASGRLIVLAEQTVGRGRVLFVATDALWKWHTLTPSDEDGRTLHGKFWQQALRALTPRRVSAAGLWLQADRTHYETGSRVTLVADASAIIADGLKLEGAVVLPDQRRLPISFTADATEPDQYSTQFDAVAPGRYRVSLAATVDGQVVAEASTVLEATTARGELDDLGADRAALTRIASHTGGQVIDPTDERTWPTIEKHPVAEVDERRTLHLGDQLVLLILLCLVLGGDWLLRMLRGYI